MRLRQIGTGRDFIVEMKYVPDASAGGVTYPLDEVPGALAAWGLVPLASSMIGQNGFQLQKTSGGATSDFAFADDSTPIATVQAWKGADAAYNNLAASFSAVYDQVGSNHLSQATQNSQPSWLTLPDGTVCATMGGNTQGREAFWSIPNMSLNGRNVTVYHVFRGNDRTWSGSSSEASNQLPTFGWLVSGGFAGWTGFETPAYKVGARTWRGGSYDDTFSRPSNCQVQVAAMRCNGTNTLYSLNDAVRSITGAQVNGTLTSGSVGKLANYGIYSLNSQWLATLIYPAQSDTEMSATFAALRARFGTAAWTHNVLFDGDSITAGHTENQGSYDVRYNAWPYELHAAMENPALRFSNTAISSQTLATMETNAANKVDSSYSASAFGTKNILVVFAGTNDIHFGASAATTISRYETYVTSRRAAGWNKIIACTAIPREPFSGAQNTDLATFNASVVANSIGADAVVDLAALSWAFGTHYQGSTPNRIHPNAAGRELIVNAVKSDLEALL